MAGALLEINGTLPCIAGSFVIFTVIMRSIFYNPIFKIREKREENFNGLKNDALSAENETLRLENEYTGKIKAARKTVSDNTAKALSESNHKKAQILESKKKDISEYLVTERQQIQNEKAESLKNLDQYITSFAADISNKILGTEVVHDHH